MSGTRVRRTMNNLIDQAKVWTTPEWKILVFDGAKGRCWTMKDFCERELINFYDIRKVKDFEYLFIWKLLIVEVE